MRPARPWRCSPRRARCAASQAAHAGDRIEARAAHQSRVHHRAHAGMVRLVSAMLVASTTLRCPAARRREHRVLRRGRQICRTAAAAPRRARRRLRASSRLHAADLACAGQEHQHVARLRAQRALHQLRHLLLRRRHRSRACGRGGQERQAAAGICISTAKARPGELTSGASPSSCATRAPSSVADMTRMRNAAPSWRAHPAPAPAPDPPAGCARGTHRR